MSLDVLLKNKRPLIMGIINMTPDSFYDGNKYNTVSFIKKKIMELIESDVDIIDIGGESSRPGANPIPFNTELERVEPVFKIIKEFPETIFSIDTYKSKIAEIAVNNGFKIINDITAGNWDEKMFSLVKKYNVAMIIMHMKDSPKNMQDQPYYDDIIEILLTFFKERIKVAKDYGINDSQIILDPGIGFGKNIEDNFKIIKNLNEISSLGYPLLIGTSRKSFLQINNDNPKDRLPATIASVTIAIQNGAKIVRVHDVKEVYKSIKIAERLYKNV